MASFETSRPLTSNRTGGAGLSKFISHLVGIIITWNDTRVTRNALSRLSDHELDDLGLTRGDVYSMTGPLTR